MARKQAAAGGALPITLSAEMPRGGSHCTALAFSPNGRRLVACGYDRKLHLYDVAGAKCVASNQEHSGPIDAVAFSLDSTRFATVGQRRAGRKSQGGEVLVWQADDGKLLGRAAVGPDAGEADFGPLLFAPGGAEVVCVLEGDEETALARIDLASYEQTGSVESVSAGPLAFSPDGKTLAAAQDDGVVLFDFPGGNQLDTIGQEGGARALSYSPDGSRLAVVDAACAVHLLDAATGDVLATLREPRPDVEHVQFSADGTFLATIGATMHGTSEAPVRIWHVQSQQVRVAFAGRSGVEQPRGFPGACALSPDFQWFANAGNKTRLWRVSW